MKEMSKRIKIGETWLVVNEYGQLCELVNLPVQSLKDQVVEVDDQDHIEEPVNGLEGRFGTIHFVFRKKDTDDSGW